MASLNLTPKLSFEPRFRLFIVNGYYTKKQTLVVLGLTIYHFLFIFQNFEVTIISDEVKYNYQPRMRLMTMTNNQLTKAYGN